MNTRSRQRSAPRTSESFDEFEGLHDDSLEALSEAELEALLFDDDDEDAKSSGIFNLPTMAGLSLIIVGVVYLFQEMGLGIGFDVSVLAGMLPWLAGILIILLGFGVLSWRPKKNKKKVKKKTIETSAGREEVVVEEVETSRKKGRKSKKLTKTRDKKISGVCGGIAEYFGIDPTLVRIAFVIGTIASGGPFVFAYILLAMVMPKPEKKSKGDERVVIIRD